MNKLINSLLKKYQTEDIEQALVVAFIENNNITVEKNNLIKDIITSTTLNRHIISEILNEKKSVGLYDLVNCFELLIPPEDQKLNGAFFTPEFLTTHIIEEVVKTENDLVCDPSCGCGAFLLKCAEYFAENFQKNIREVIEKNLYGVDIASYSVRRAKILLNLLLLSKKTDEEDIKINIITSDSLTLTWETTFPEVFQHGGFDIVMGNPPYVKFQDLPVDLRKNLGRWETVGGGNFNLYFTFFELGIKLLKNGGNLGYITPNNYFTSLAGLSLRKYFSKNKYLQRILDFNHLKLFSAQTYTCLTFLKKDNNKKILYGRIDTQEDLKDLDSIEYSTINPEGLLDKKWRLLNPGDSENIKIIENLRYKLGEIFDIRVGIATCLDIAYFMDSKNLDGDFYVKEYKENTYRIEKEITKKIVKVSDFSNQDELENNTRIIIFPYKRLNDKTVVIPQVELREKYPMAYKYFSDIKIDLESRDKGKKKYNEWYIYARNQGLDFYGSKLLTPTFSSSPRFLYEKNPDSLFCNGYAIFEKQKQGLFQDDNFKLDLLAKILNSRIMDYYIKKTSVSIEGGYPCFQKNFIELFGIPEFSKEDILYLLTAEDREDIDNFLIKKYGVNI